MRNQLDNLLREALASLRQHQGLEKASVGESNLERTRDPRHGDFSTNVALRLAKTLKRPPRELAADVVAAIPASPIVEKVEIAGPGFINFTLTEGAYRDELATILRAGAAYGSSDSGAGHRVLVEYLSANPTGPLHVGHGRNAAYGACVANLLRATGHEVHEEYYVNDAGRQMDILAASVWLRYAALCGEAVPFPDNAYQGGYISEIAEELKRLRGAALTGDVNDIAAAAQRPEADEEKRLDLTIGAIKRALGAEQFANVLKLSLDNILGDIKQDLADFGVNPQRWYSEATLVDNGTIEQALARLRERSMLYERDGATWFRSSDYGDEKDRVVIRENGATTYFASDIAYHYDKRLRGYTRLLDILGADHHGYVARLRAGLQAMGEPPECFEARLVQFVTLYRGQVKAQMSTRAGEFVTLRQLREEVGTDAARFFYVLRSNDQHLDFDLELAKAESQDNPVYYVQYAHARVASMLRKMEESGTAFGGPDGCLDRLSEAAERELMVALSRYPEVVELAADNRAPQHLVHYLRDTAASFHAYYNAHRILVDDSALRNARIALALATQQVVRNGLSLLGVSAPDRM